MKPFWNLVELWELASQFFFKWHIPHLMTCTSTLVLLLFNTKKAHNFVTWCHGAQQFWLVVSYVNCCFQSVYSLACHSSSTTPWTCSTSSDNIKHSSLFTTNLSGPTMASSFTKNPKTRRHPSPKMIQQTTYAKNTENTKKHDEQ